MKIILLKNIVKVGIKGDVKEVSDGYGRNFLLPNKLAEVASPGALQKLAAAAEAQKNEAGRMAEEFKKFGAELAKKAKDGIKISKPADEKGGLYSALSAEEVFSALTKAGLAPPAKSEIELSETIKSAGVHKVYVAGPGKEKAVFNVEVIAEKEKPKPRKRG